MVEFAAITVKASFVEMTELTLVKNVTVEMIATTAKKYNAEIID